MSVVEGQAKEVGVDAAGGAKDGGQRRDTMIVSVGMLYLWAFSLAASRSGLEGGGGGGGGVL
jgi:hypothetical protein